MRRRTALAAASLIAGASATAALITSAVILGTYAPPPDVNPTRCFEDQYRISSDFLPVDACIDQDDHELIYDPSTNSYHIEAR